MASLFMQMGNYSQACTYLKEAVEYLEDLLADEDEDGERTSISMRSNSFRRLSVTGLAGTVNYKRNATMTPKLTQWVT